MGCRKSITDIIEDSNFEQGQSVKESLSAVIAHCAKRVPVSCHPPHPAFLFCFFCRIHIFFYFFIFIYLFYKLIIGSAVWYDAVIS